MTDLVKDGYCVIDSVFGAENLLNLELAIKDMLGIEDADFPKSAAVTDALNKSYRLAEAVMHPKLLGALVSELGEDFMFMQHCDVLVNSTTKLGRHSVDRKEDCTGECWDNDAPYSVVRVLAFVEEDEVSLIPDTHLIPGKDEKKAIKVAVPVGSVFIHDARLYTGFPEIEAPRYAVTPFFGLPDKHSKRHHNFITQQRRDLGYNGANPKLHRLLSSTKVLYHD